MKQLSVSVGALASALAMFAIGCVEFHGRSDATQVEGFDPEARLGRLGIVLADPPKPVANYVNGVRTGNLIFLAGKGPRRADGSFEKIPFGVRDGMTYGLAVADWNGDGRPEIATANSDGQNYLYQWGRR